MARRSRGWAATNAGAYGYEPKARRASTKYEQVATVVSRRDPDRKWSIKRNRETGALSCDCPSWIFKPQCGDCGEPLAHVGGGVLRCEKGHGTVGLPGGPARSCKHVRAYLADQEAQKVAAAASNTIERVREIARADRAKAASLVVSPAMGETFSILKSAGVKIGITISDGLWMKLAKEVASKLGRVSPLEAEPDLVLGAVRVITLED
jgi:hypothetical protein